MRATISLPLVALAGALALSAPDASAQSLTLSPTYQQSIASYEGRVFDFLSGDQPFQAWGFMMGLERPGRFWQPHLWFQRYEIGNPCPVPTEEVECGNEGWVVSVGPGLRVVETPHLTGMVLAQVGLQSRRAGGFTGGAGFHLGVKLGAVEPRAFGQYQMIRGAHYATVGAGLVFALPYGRPGERR